MIRNLLLYLITSILSLTVHEFAHAFVATKLGDDTAEREDRLTLSPLAHIDPVGTLLIPIIAAVSHTPFFFGWARPVPVNPARFRRNINMRAGMALTAAAGPLSNLVLSFVSLLALVGLQRASVLTPGVPAADAVRALLESLFSMNIGLFVFNLLPLPPFDGSRLLPRSADPIVERLAPYTFFIVLGIMMVPPLRFVLIDWPYSTIRDGMRTLVGSL